MYIEYSENVNNLWTKLELIVYIGIFRSENFYSTGLIVWLWGLYNSSTRLSGYDINSQKPLRQYLNCVGRLLWYMRTVSAFYLFAVLTYHAKNHTLKKNVWLNIYSNDSLVVRIWNATSCNSNWCAGTDSWSTCFNYSFCIFSSSNTTWCFYADFWANCFSH